MPWSRGAEPIGFDPWYGQREDEVEVQTALKPSILIIEDDSSLLVIYKTLLEDQFRIYTAEHCTGQKIKIADIVDKYDALAPLTHSRAASGSRAAPLACLVDLRGCFESDQIHSEKHSWLGVLCFFIRIGF